MTPTVRNVGPFLVALTLAVITTGGLAIAAGSSSASAASSVGMLNPGVYGPGMGYDAKGNIPITLNQKMAYRFKASTSSALTGVRFTQRSGPGGYSAGTGGTMTVSVRAGDGSGHPAATALASLTFNPKAYATPTEIFDLKTFSSAATLTSGKIYYIVFTGSSATNYISVNMVWAQNGTTPRQPKFADADFGMMYTSGTWGALNANHTPVVDLVYANGTIDGQSYFEAMIAHYATISGTSKMARERFTVSGGNRTVRSASLRVRRSGGTSPLRMTLATSAGVAIESVTVPAASVPVSAPGGANGGAVWVTANFSSPHVLSNGASYSLRISTASGTTYTTFPVRAGTDKGLATYAFSGGSGQFTTNGTTWTDLYAYSHQDLQFYFKLVPAAATSPIQFGRIQYNSPGTDTTANASVNGEYVVIRNLGYTARSLTGWIVRDAAQNHVYRFGTFTLGARKSVVLRTGKGTNTSITRYWGLGWHVWNNTGGDKVYLRSAAGTGMDYCAWTTSGVGYKIC